MPYVVTKASPRFRQISWQEFLFEDVKQYGYSAMCQNDTVTRYMEHVPRRIAEQFSLRGAIHDLKLFNDTYRDLFQVTDRHELYHTYYIPKRSGGARRIDEPLPDLMNALRCLKQLFETRFQALYHTAAYAYVARRSTVDLVKKHQGNESMWFVHYDFTNFFGSITPEFLSRMLSMLWPFSAVMENPGGKMALEQALSLCFLDGGLPQGTPISPLLTNLVMIPIDHRLNNGLKTFDQQNYVYTRYADDISISSRKPFDYKKLEQEITTVLQDFDAPIKLNDKKTQYGNRNGSNWMFGMMLNKDNHITVGWRNAKEFKSTLNTYLYERSQGIYWPADRLRSLGGTISYYNMIDREWTEAVLEVYNKKFQTSIRSCIKQDLKRR